MHCHLKNPRGSDPIDDSNHDSYRCCSSHHITNNRDKNKCQFFLGKWNDGKHYPDKIKIIDANTVHHIIPIKERPDLALDIDNMVSLSFEAHEIIEERHRWTWRKKKKTIAEERW